MGRTVADAHLLLRAMAGDDRRYDPMTTGQSVEPALEPADLPGLRAAVSEDLGGVPVDPVVRATFRERVGLIKGLFRSCEWHTPDLVGADRAFAVIRAQQYLSTYKAPYQRQRDQLGEYIVWNYEEGLTMTASDVAEAHATQTRLYRVLQRFFDDFDLLICPTVAVPPFPIEDGYVKAIDGQPMRTYYSWLALTYYLSLTGHPCISLPCGLDATGTPFGLQLVAPAHEDNFLLKVALALEQAMARDIRTARPLPSIQ